MCCMTDFYIYKSGVKGSTLHEHVIMMFSVFFSIFLRTMQSKEEAIRVSLFSQWCGLKKKPFG